MNPIIKKSFPNGVSCLALTTTRSAPLNISLYYPGGRLFETDANSGITYLLLRRMLKRNQAMFANSMNLDIQVENHADFSGFSLDVPTEHFTSALQVLFHLVTTPLDESTSLDSVKEESNMEILKTSMDPLRRPVELFYQSLFAGHPYAFSRFGTTSNVSSISMEQLKDWRNEVVRMDRMLIVVTGALSSEKVCDEVFEIFGLIPTQKQPPRAIVLPLVPFRKFKPRVEESEQDRTSIVVGHKGVDAKDHRYYDLEILRNWLAGSRGKLHQSLRERLSIAQSVNAYNISLLRGGAFFLHAISRPEHESQLTDYMTAFFSSLGKLVISDEEFEAAKQQAIDLFFHGLQNHDALSYYIASQFVAGKDPTMCWDYESKIRKVQLSKMTSTIREIFSEEMYAVGVVRGECGQKDI